MTVTLHWFIPTSGDSRTNIGLGGATGVHGVRYDLDRGERAPDIKYLTQIACAAEAVGFTGALLPVSSWCEDGWVVASALSQVTTTFRFLVAFRPGLVSPTVSAAQAATFQRVSGNRLLLNVVVGGEDIEQQRYGDYLDKDARYARADEFLSVVRGSWGGEPFDFDGEYVKVTGAEFVSGVPFPGIYLGGSSEGALTVAARHADVFLTWGEPPALAAEKIARARAAAAAEGRALRFGIRLHVITRDTNTEAWAEADRLLSALDPAFVQQRIAEFRASQSEGQLRMTSLHDGHLDRLVVGPNLWAGVGLVRAGAGTALVGSHSEVADRIEEYRALGITEFILSGYPHLEEVYRVGEGLIPELRRRGVMRDPAREVLAV